MKLIIDLSTGSDLQVISDETHSVSAYYYTAIESPVELSSDSILYKKYIYTDTGYSNTMYKYTLSTKENKALLADDEANWMDQQYYNLSNPQVFNGKVYINHYHYKYDPSNPTPVYIEGTTNVAYSNYYSTAFEVLEYNISDDSIKSIFTISNYTNEIEVATHNGEPKIVVNQSVPVAAEGKTYTTINRLSIYNIDGSFILNMVANHSMYTDIIDNKIAMIDYDYTAQPKVATLYMLPDSGSTPIVQQVLSSLNTTYMNFFSYYGGIAVQYQDTTSEYSSVGILKDISNLDSFIKVDAVNATINNYND